MEPGEERPRGATGWRPCAWGFLWGARRVPGDRESTGAPPVLGQRSLRDPGLSVQVPALPLLPPGELCVSSSALDSATWRVPVSHAVICSDTCPFPTRLALYLPPSAAAQKHLWSVFHIERTLPRRLALRGQKPGAGLSLRVKSPLWLLRGERGCRCGRPWALSLTPGLTLAAAPTPHPPVHGDGGRGRGPGRPARRRALGQRPECGRSAGWEGGIGPLGIHLGPGEEGPAAGTPAGPQSQV